MNGEPATLPGQVSEDTQGLRPALNSLLEHYLSIANSGDCGHWDPEKEAVVIRARAALAGPDVPMEIGMVNELLRLRVERIEKFVKQQYEQIPDLLTTLPTDRHIAYQNGMREVLIGIAEILESAP